MNLDWILTIKIQEEYPHNLKIIKYLKIQKSLNKNN